MTKTILGVVIVISITVAVVLGIRALYQQPARQTDSRPIVVATVPHVASWLEDLSAGSLRIETIVPPGSEIHDFSFSPAGAQILDQAELLVANGAGLEPWLADIAAAYPRLPIVETTRGLALTANDPHTWLDPLLAAQQVAAAGLALQQAFPAQATSLAQNTEELRATLRNLDQEIRTGLTQVNGRHFVAFHNAFSYFARRYGLEQVGELVERPGDEPTFADIEALQRTVQELTINTLFVEPGPVPDIARTFAAELNLKIAILNPLETIEPMQGAYLAAMRINLEALRVSLDKTAN
ncbi:MAG: metal ABC transporter substrate-binding protein [Parcubacteria group bacterium]